MKYLTFGLVALLVVFGVIWAVSPFFESSAGQRQRNDFVSSHAKDDLLFGIKLRANGRTIELESDDYENVFARQLALTTIFEQQRLGICSAGFNSIYLYRSGGWFHRDSGTRAPVECAGELETAAAGILTTIHTAETTYNSAYNIGYSRKLSDLAYSPSADVPSASSAGLIDEVMGAGVKCGYTYTYVPTAEDSNGHVRSYSVNADPASWQTEPMAHFFVDQSGKTRVNETQSASVSDPEYDIATKKF